MQSSGNTLSDTERINAEELETQLLPEREEGIKPSIRSCLNCRFNSFCKVYEVEASHVARLKEMLERSGLKGKIDLLPPEAIGSRCSLFECDVSA